MLDFRPKLKNTIGSAVVMAAVMLSYAFTIARPSAAFVKRAVAIDHSLDTGQNSSTLVNSIKAVADSLASIKRHLPIEKVYLHTDKAYYNVGDTLWFKAYLTDGANRASKHSALLYVEIDDDSADVVRRISIPIKQGTGIGQIPLPRKVFKEGAYTLRAYTNWMQNFGSDYFFKHRFYLAMPTQATWLVRSTAALEPVGDKNRLDVDVKLYLGSNRKPVSLSNVEVKIYEGRYYLFKEEMRTGIDGSLIFSKLLKDKVDGRDLNIQITSLEKQYPNKVIRIPLIINRDGKIDLQFLPEGGKLVADIPSVVGFKAIGEDGRGIDIKATILDSKGTKVADISSLHHGMGSFKLTPEAGQTYVAKLIGSRSNNKTYNLPAVSATGVVMHIDNPEEGALKIAVQASGGIGPDSSYHIEGIAKDRIFYSEKITAKNSSLTVDKITFPSGIVRFTLFKGTTPVAERAVFIDHKDRLDIRIVTNKDAYQKRDSVGIDIEVKDGAGIPVQGSFSLSVTDNTLVKPDILGNFSIATSLLLKTGLKGDIENPGYYITRKDPKAWQALDNLMLTQGWTGYDWKDVFATPTAPKFAVEKDLSITGNVVNILNKPVANAPVLISSQHPQFTSMVFTDKDGRYQFKNLPRTDSASFFLQGQTKSGKSMSFGAIEVDKINYPNVPETYRTPILPWFVNSDTSQLDLVKRIAQKQKQALSADPIGEGTMLKNVTISRAKVIEGGELNGRADFAFDEADIKESTTQTLYQLLKQKIPGFRIRQDWTNHGGYATARMDGYRTVNGVRDYSEHFIDIFVIDAEYIDFIGENKYSVEQYKQNLMDVIIPRLKTLEVVWSPQFVPMREFQRQRVLGCRPHYYGVVYINTLTGVLHPKAKVGTTTYRPLPVMQPKKFYSPRYVANAAAKEPDYRSTIHWEPQLYTDYNGKARISFYTSDLPKDYTINIQGMSPEGEIGGLVQKMGNKPVSAANTKP